MADRKKKTTAGKGRPKARARSKKTTAKSAVTDAKIPANPEVLEPDIVDPSPKPVVDPIAEDIVLEPEILDEKLPVLKEEHGLVPSDPVARYMAEIRRYPLLSREQEYEIAVKYRETGDPELAHKLVTSNLRFVVKVAAEYSKFGARLIDLIQEGNVGLMHAVKEFNPYKGVRLITYAVWWIRGYIQEFLMRHYSMVRIGTTHRQRKLFYELQRSRDQLERMGMEAGILQISHRMGIPEEEVREMSGRVLSRDLSLDLPVGEDERASVMDITRRPDETSFEDELVHREQLHLLTEHLEKLRPELNEREIYLLDHRLLADEPMTLQEIGDRYGITREAARQMEARLIGKIRKQMIE